MTSDDVAFWSMIGTWFASIATFLAVLSAIYFSKLQTRIRIKANMSIVTYGDFIEEMDEFVAMGECLRIEVINFSHVPIKVDEVSFVRKNFKQYFPKILRNQMVDQSRIGLKGHFYGGHGDLFTKKLMFSDSGKYEWNDNDAATTNNWYVYLKNELKRNHIPYDDFMLMIKLNTGDIFYVNIPRNIINIINKDLRKTI